MWVRIVLGHTLAGGPYLTFFPAVLLSALLGGLGPGLIAVIESTIVAWYYLLPPENTFVLPGLPDGFGLILFMLLATVDVLLISAVLRASQREHLERMRLAAVLDENTRLLEERIWMSQEIQHRVANSLLMVSQLLKVQKDLISDPMAVKTLASSARRVETIGEIHRQLKTPKDQKIEVGDYIAQLCHRMIEALGAGRITCTVNCPNWEWSADLLTPVALIIHELVSNAIEHAFPMPRTGEISVTLTALDETLIRLEVADDGVGLDAERLQDNRNFGLSICEALVRRLGGWLTLSDSGGVVAEIVFPKIQQGFLL